MSRLLSHIIAFLSVMMLMVSCSTSRRGVPVAVSNQKGPKHAELSVPPLDGLHPSSKALVSEASGWLGTPYKYGGEDHDGVDCSGLVMKVYNKVLDIKLPRSSSEQRDYCSPVSVGSLIPGDLLFFATGKSADKVSHVGIFIGEGKMIHASASRGVIVSDISENYYVSKFTCAGSVDSYHAMLQSAPTAPAAPETQPLPQPLSEPKPEAVEVAAAVPAVAEPIQPEPVADVNGAAKVEVVSSSAEAAKVTEPTPADARAAVLNAIIERKLN